MSKLLARTTQLGEYCQRQQPTPDCVSNISVKLLFAVKLRPGRHEVADRGCDRGKNNVLKRARDDFKTKKAVVKDEVLFVQLQLSAITSILAKVLILNLC